MNSPSEDIKDILEAESSLALTFSNDLFISREPISPANCVTIFDTQGGIPPQLTFNRAEVYEYPSIQIRVRSKKYLTGWNLINGIKSLLHGRGHETWNGTYYSLITASSSPALLDYDESDRARFICNFNIQRR